MLIEILEGVGLIIISGLLAALLIFKNRKSDRPWPNNPHYVNALIVMIIATGAFGLALEIDNLLLGGMGYAEAKWQ